MNLSEELGIRAKLYIFIFYRDAGIVVSIASSYIRFCFDLTEVTCRHFFLISDIYSGQKRLAMNGKNINDRNMKNKSGFTC